MTDTACSDSCVSNRGWVKPLFVSDLYPLKLVNVKCILFVCGCCGLECSSTILYLSAFGNTNNILNGLLHVRLGVGFGVGNSCKQCNTNCE